MRGRSSSTRGGRGITNIHTGHAHGSGTDGSLSSSSSMTNITIPSTVTASATSSSGICRVCYEARNVSQLITCVACGVTVHRTCYRVKQQVEANDWHCNRCASGDDGVACVLCPGRDGAFKRITDKRWCHLDCIRWFPDARVDRVPTASWGAACYLCNSRHGAVVECLAGAASCGLSFHPSCARQHRLLTIATPQAKPSVPAVPRVGPNGRRSLPPLVQHHMAAYCASHAASHSQTRHTNGRQRVPSSPGGIITASTGVTGGIAAVTNSVVAAAAALNTASSSASSALPSGAPPLTTNVSSSSTAVGLVEEEEDRVCSVCYNGDHEHGNEIVFCDRCDIGVHQSCYGIATLPEGDWYCRRCERGVGRVRCVLCPSEEGAFKPTNDGRWVHVLCALWIPGTSWGDALTLEPLNNVGRINPARFKLQCSICSVAHGACVQCSSPDCTVAFHASCAQQSRLHMEVKEIPLPAAIVATAANEGPDYKLIAYCRRHSGLPVEPVRRATKLKRRLSQLEDNDKIKEESATSSITGGSGSDVLTKMKLLRRTASIANGIIGTVIESEEDTSDDNDEDAQDTAQFERLVQSYFRPLTATDLHRLTVDPHHVTHTAATAAAIIDGINHGTPPVPPSSIIPQPVAGLPNDPCFNIPPLGRGVRPADPLNGAYLPRLPSYTSHEDIWLRLGKTLTSSQYIRPRYTGLLHNDHPVVVTSLLRNTPIHHTASSSSSLSPVKNESSSVSSIASSTVSSSNVTFQSAALCEYVMTTSSSLSVTSSLSARSSSSSSSTLPLPNGIGLTLTAVHPVYDRTPPLVGNTVALQSSSSSTASPSVARIPRRVKTEGDGQSSSDMNTSNDIATTEDNSTYDDDDDHLPEGNLLAELQTQQRLLASQMTIGNAQRERLLAGIIARGGAGQLMDSVIRARHDGWKRSQNIYRFAASWQVVRLALYRGVRDASPGGSQAGQQRRDRERAKAAAAAATATSTSHGDDVGVAATAVASTSATGEPITPPRTTSLADIPRTRGQAVQRQLTGNSVSLLTGSSASSSSATSSTVSSSDDTSTSMNEDGDDGDDCEDYTVCCVCFSGDASEENPIVFCERCNIAVHKGCYGIATVPEDDWFCHYCQAYPRGTHNADGTLIPGLDRVGSSQKKGGKSGRGGRGGGRGGRPGRRSHDDVQRSSSNTSLAAAYGIAGGTLMDTSSSHMGSSSSLAGTVYRNSRYSCALCTTPGGALKRTDDGAWAHVVCALWIPKARVADVTVMEPITGVDHAIRYSHRVGGVTCSVCRRDHGGYVQCSGDNGTCGHHFHPLCAWYAGCYMSIHAVDAQCRFFLYCPAHTPDVALSGVDTHMAMTAPLITLPLSTAGTNTSGTELPSLPPTSIPAPISTSSNAGAAPSFSFEGRDGRIVTCPFIDTFHHANPTIERIIRYRLEQQRDLRNRGRQEQTRKMKRKRRKKRQEERKLRAGRARAQREDRYETDRCAVCFKTDDEWRLFTQLEQEVSTANAAAAAATATASTTTTSSGAITSTAPGTSVAVDPTTGAPIADWSSHATATGATIPVGVYPMSTPLPTTVTAPVPSPSPSPSPLSATGTTRANRMVRCDRCEMDVHQQCYGITDIELDRINAARAAAKQQNQQLYGEGDGSGNGTNNSNGDGDASDEEDSKRSGWLCARCQSTDKDVSCVICPRRGGALKRTVGGRWCHIPCAQWIPEVTFGDTILMEHIDGMNDISKARRNLRCYLCKRAGPCIQCSDQCSTAFHPLCGLLSGQYMSMHEDRTTGSTTFTACCRRHTPLHLARGIDIPPAYSTLIKLRRHLDKARTLIDLVKRREKLKQRSYQAAMDVCEYQWALAKPSHGPYAHRFSQQFMQSLQGGNDDPSANNAHILSYGHGGHMVHPLAHLNHNGMMMAPMTDSNAAAAAAYYGYNMMGNVGYAPMAMTSTTSIAGPAPTPVRSRGGRKKSQGGSSSTPSSTSNSTTHASGHQMIDLTNSTSSKYWTMVSVPPTSSTSASSTLPTSSPSSSSVSSSASSSGSGVTSARKSGRDRRPSAAVRDTLGEGATLPPSAFNASSSSTTSTSSSSIASSSSSSGDMSAPNALPSTPAKRGRGKRGPPSTPVASPSVASATPSVSSSSSSTSSDTKSVSGDQYATPVKRRRKGEPALSTPSTSTTSTSSSSTPATTTTSTTGASTSRGGRRKVPTPKAKAAAAAAGLPVGDVAYIAGTRSGTAAAIAASTASLATAAASTSSPPSSSASSKTANDSSDTKATSPSSSATANARGRGGRGKRGGRGGGKSGRGGKAAAAATTTSATSDDTVATKSTDDKSSSDAPSSTSSSSLPLPIMDHTISSDDAAAIAIASQPTPKAARRSGRVSRAPLKDKNMGALTPKASQQAKQSLASTSASAPAAAETSSTKKKDSKKEAKGSKKKEASSPSSSKKKDTKKKVKGKKVSSDEEEEEEAEAEDDEEEEEQDDDEEEASKDEEEDDGEEDEEEEEEADGEGDDADADAEGDSGEGEGDDDEEANDDEEEEEEEEEEEDDKPKEKRKYTKKSATTPTPRGRGRVGRPPLSSSSHRGRGRGMGGRGGTTSKQSPRGSHAGVVFTPTGRISRAGQGYGRGHGRGHSSLSAGQRAVVAEQQKEAKERNAKKEETRLARLARVQNRQEEKGTLTERKKRAVSKSSGITPGVSLPMTPKHKPKTATAEPKKSKKKTTAATTTDVATTSTTDTPTNNDGKVSASHSDNSGSDNEKKVTSSSSDNHSVTDDSTSNHGKKRSRDDDTAETSDTKDDTTANSSNDASRSVRRYGKRARGDSPAVTAMDDAFTAAVADVTASSLSSSHAPSSTSHDGSEMASTTTSSSSSNHDTSTNNTNDGDRDHDRDGASEAASGDIATPLVTTPAKRHRKLPKRTETDRLLSTPAMIKGEANAAAAARANYYSTAPSLSSSVNGSTSSSASSATVSTPGRSGRNSAGMSSADDSDSSSSTRGGRRSTPRVKRTILRDGDNQT